MSLKGQSRQEAAPRLWTTARGLRMALREILQGLRMLHSRSSTLRLSAMKQLDSFMRRASESIGAGLWQLQSSKVARMIYAILSCKRQTSSREALLKDEREVLLIPQAKALHPRAANRATWALLKALSAVARKSTSIPFYPEPSTK